MNYSALTDAQLLGKLVGLKQARKHYAGALTPLFTEQQTTSAHELCSVARELVERWLREDLRRGCVLSQPEAVRKYLRMQLGALEHEVFVVLLLDSQNRLIATEELFRGTVSQTAVYPREVVKVALRHNAAAAVFAHNHPSGVAEPSRADELLTQSLKQALALVDVKVLDHFIVGSESAMSFAERGLL